MEWYEFFMITWPGAILGVAGVMITALSLYWVVRKVLKVFGLGLEWYEYEDEGDQYDAFNKKFGYDEGGCVKGTNGTDD